MSRLRIVITSILALVMLCQPPAPVLAQVRYCASLDFTQGYGALYATTGTWVSGQGWQTQHNGLYNALDISTTALDDMRLDSISILWSLSTWGGGTAGENNVAFLDSGSSVYMINVAPVQTPGNYLLTWEGDESITGTLIIHLLASGSGGSGGLGYMRSMDVCGSVLPEEWSPQPAGGFVASNPWPDATPWARATPTPWPTPEATLPFGVVDSDLGNVTDVAINMYHFANQQGGIDTLVFFLMTALILILIFRVIRKLKEES